METNKFDQNLEADLTGALDVADDLKQTDIGAFIRNPSHLPFLFKPTFSRSQNHSIQKPLVPDNSGGYWGRIRPQKNTESSTKGKI